MRSIRSWKLLESISKSSHRKGITNSLEKPLPVNAYGKRTSVYCMCELGWIEEAIQFHISFREGYMGDMLTHTKIEFPVWQD